MSEIEALEAAHAEQPQAARHVAARQSVDPADDECEQRPARDDAAVLERGRLLEATQLGQPALERLHGQHALLTERPDPEPAQGRDMRPAAQLLADIRLVDHRTDGDLHCAEITEGHENSGLHMFDRLG